jgi:hypothetical protein
MEIENGTIHIRIDGTDEKYGIDNCVTIYNSNIVYEKSI